MKKAGELLALVGAVLLLAAPGLADNELYVVARGVGPPVGTRITSLPYTISSPGFYYLAGSLAYSGTADGITVASDDVTIDLKGFQISGPGSTSSSRGIMLYDGTTGHKNVEVRNGTISGWHSGFSDGAAGLGGNRALNLNLESCGNGIDLEASSSNNLVKGCIAEDSDIGIYMCGGVATGNSVNGCTTGIQGYGTISTNVVINSTSQAIDCVNASSIIGNTIVIPSTGTPVGIQINTDGPVLLTKNTVSGSGTHVVPGKGTVNVNNAGF